jgi:tetratricopeptide (TPR) repeat protein
VYEVTGLGPLRTRLQRAAGRGLTKFVGREREMEALRHAAGLARGEHGQVVAVMAEPGVGKSRLFHEFKATSASGWMVLEAYSVSHGKASAYLPVLDLLHAYFKIIGEDDQRTRREKLTGRLLALDRNLEDTLPYLFTLLGIVVDDDPLAQMDGQIKKRRTLEAIKRVILRESLNQPLIVIFEDLHWIDEQTQELLNLLADSIGTAKILLLVNYRPEYSHQWNSKTYYTQLRLDPLGNDTAEEMLSALLTSLAPATQSQDASRERSAVDIHIADAVRAQDELVAFKRLIAETTEGNPFFMEEIVQSLFEEGVLLRNGTVKLAKSMNAVKVPPTVHAVLASRLDRLPVEEKELLQTLAVIGREFPLALAARLLAISDDEELNRRLFDLQLGEFIYEQPASGGIEYIFKHALTQEVAYNSLLIDRRKQIHERAAQATESLFAANLADHYSELAHHYTRSGNVPKAVNYLHLAAQQAMSRSAYVEASGQLTAALDFLGAQPDNIEHDRTEIAVRFSLAICMELSMGDLEAGARVLERARELSEKIGDDVTLFEVISFLAFLSNVRLDHQGARVLYERALGIALLQRNPEMVGHARTWLAYAYFYEGNLIAAMNEFEQIDKLSITPSLKRGAWPFNWQVQYRVVASFTSWLLGYPQRAADKSKESLFVARELKGSPDLGSALWWSALLNLQIKNSKMASAQAEEAINLAAEHGIVSFFALTALLRGWALAQKGQISEGLHEMVQCRTELIQSGQLIILCWLYTGLAEIYLAASRLTEGLEAVGEGLELAQHTGTRVIEAETRRLKGELLLIGDNDATSEVAQCFRDAIELAQRQSAKSFELRATMSLARLLAKQGKRDEARTMLVDIYSWFTEGFDTADLKDAKALLDRLNSKL